MKSINYQESLKTMAIVIGLIGLIMIGQKADRWLEENHLMEWVR